MAKRQVLLELTFEQEETIKALFRHNEWEYKEVTTLKAKRRRVFTSKNDSPNEVQNSNEDDVPVVVQHMQQDDECMFCFQSPCITERNLEFVGRGQTACEYNSAIRREKYGKYWKVINNVGGWMDPRYLASKQARTNGGEWAIQHRREVMPQCVLVQLRGLYPNPKDKPYMDHKWE